MHCIYKEKRKISSMEPSKESEHNENHMDFQNATALQNEYKKKLSTGKKKEPNTQNRFSFFFFLSFPVFNSNVHEVCRTEKNIYMLNYDLTLLFKQFILMWVVV